MKILQIRVGTIAETLKGKHVWLCKARTRLFHAGFETQSRRHQKSKTGPTTWTYVLQKIKNKTIPFKIHIKILLIVQIEFLFVFLLYA